MLNVAHTPESLAMIQAEVGEFQQRLQVLIAAMNVHGCESLVVNYHGEMERGMKAFRNFVSDAETRLLDWRTAQGHFGQRVPAPILPPQKTKKPAKK